MKISSGAASYKVLIKASAVKELESVPLNQRRRLANRVKNLGVNPRPVVSERLTGKDRFRIRQGDYRAVYEIRDDALVVLVVKVGHRKDIYQ